MLEKLNIETLSLPYRIKLCLPSDIFVNFQEMLVDRAEVDIDLLLEQKFLNDKKNISLALKGNVCVNTKIPCIRCLESLNYRLFFALDVKLVPLKKGRTLHDLSEDEFPVIDNAINLVEILEECLILEVPFNPKHEKIENCKKLLQYDALIAGDEDDSVLSEMTFKETSSSPFANLKEQINRS